MSSSATEPVDTSPERIFERAVTRHRAGDLQEAARLYQAVLEAQPEHSQATHNLGAVAIQLDEPAHALPFFEAALTADPTRHQFWVSYLDALIRVEQFEEARTALALAREYGLEGDDIDEIATRLALPRVEETMDAAPSEKSRQTQKSKSSRQPKQTHDRQPSEREIQALAELFFSKRLSEALSSAEEFTSEYPDVGFGWLILGAILKQLGRSNDALLPAQRAAELLPRDADANSNLGGILKDLGRLSEAESTLRIAIGIKPDHALALSNLGATLLDQHRHDDAEHILRRALKVDPASVEALNNLGNALKGQRRLEEAESTYRRAISLNPDFFDTHYNLGALLQETSRIDEAVECYRRALEIRPNHITVLNNIAVAFIRSGRVHDAEPLLRRALEIDPDFPDTNTNLSAALIHQGRLYEAHEYCEKVVRLAPDNVLAFNNLGILLQDLGKHDAAELCYRRALELKPDFVAAADNLLFDLNYHPDKSAEEIYATYREYDTAFAEPHRRKWKPHTNSRDVRKRLKVGYVSPDFRSHSARHFLEPLFANHDKAAVELFAYAETFREDAVTARYKSYVDHWITTNGLTDDEMADRIRSDGIDILVDVAGHTYGNRLPVFARKPAPVSLTWMGYGNTTGLTAIDYFLTDDTAAPLGSDHVFSEKPWRISSPDIAYRPAENMGDVSPLPALTNGYVTFCTLTRRVRINHRTVRVWSELLKRVPGSRLVVNSANFRDPIAQHVLAAEFAEHGIERERLMIGATSPPWDVLRSVDIGLDCFPHASGTTLLETLYMGVPYVSLAERPRVGLIGSSMLRGAGHPEWITHSEEEYIEMAVALASDLSALAEIRARLRTDIQNSPIMDEPGFARKVEKAYREMFETWASSAANERIETEQLMARAVELHTANELEQAAELYQSILNRNPKDARANHNLGTIAVRMQQPDAALSFLEAALDSDPTCAQYWVSYIEALFAAGHTKDASKIFELAKKSGLDSEALDNMSRSADRAAALTEAEIQKPSQPDGKSSATGQNVPPLQQIDALRLLFGQSRFVDTEILARQMTIQYPLYDFGWKVLAASLKMLDRSHEALQPAKIAVDLAPNDPSSRNNLGAILRDVGDLSDAERTLNEALQIDPNNANVLANLGAVLTDVNRLADAEALLRKAEQINSNLLDVQYNLGVICHRTNRCLEAFNHYQQAAAIAPDNLAVLENLGLTLILMRNHSEAELVFRKILDISPERIETINSLAGTLTLQGRASEAKEWCRRVLSLAPENNVALSQLGAILQDSGDLDGAIACFQKVTELDPTASIAAGSRLFCLNYHPDKTAEEIFSAYQEYDKRYAQQLRPARLWYSNTRDLDKRLKVGYVSADFKKHSARHFLEPLLENHNKAAVEVYAYAELTFEDEYTQRYRKHVDHWICTTGLTDEQLAERIRADGIDILVDTSGHTNGNRLGTLARKPAPVSVTWMGYGSTTGLSAIDYFLTDEIAAPAGSDSYFSETPWRIANPDISYRPADDMGEISPLPALKNQYVTFCTLTRRIRINHRTIRVWSDILNRVHNSKLLISSSSFRDPEAQDLLAKEFAEHGIARDRLTINSISPPWDALRSADIGLDCFPHNSGTTLIESLYMGLPYVTLASRPRVGRIGSSILHGVGHPEWIANSEDEYVEKAVALASNLPKLSEIRGKLRTEMRNSRLMDETEFARRVEDAYRKMFRRWAEETPE